VSLTALRDRHCLQEPVQHTQTVSVEFDLHAENVQSAIAGKHCLRSMFLALSVYVTENWKKLWTHFDEIFWSGLA